MMAGSGFTKVFVPFNCFVAGGLAARAACVDHDAFVPHRERGYCLASGWVVRCVALGDIFSALEKKWAIAAHKAIKGSFFLFDLIYLRLNIVQFIRDGLLYRFSGSCKKPHSFQPFPNIFKKSDDSIHRFHAFKHLHSPGVFKFGDSTLGEESCAVNPGDGARRYAQGASA